MSFASIKSVPKADTAAEPDVLQFRIIVVMWFLYLFAPHKLIQFYVPSANPVTWILELLLYLEVALYFGRSRERRD